MQFTFCLDLLFEGIFYYNKGMQKETIILENAKKLVQVKLAGEASGHDWWHIVRVRNMACKIALEEKADAFICQLTALLHDMADEKLNDKPDEELERIHFWLLEQNLSPTDADHVIRNIRTLSFKGKGKLVPDSLEGQIVQDADRLDAIGAIGIARCMAYSGSKGRPIHDPVMKPREQLTPEVYRNGQDTAIMHFYEKLLKLKDLMNTDFGRKMAEQRHQYLENFLEEFYAEWNGQR